MKNRSMRLRFGSTGSLGYDTRPPSYTDTGVDKPRTVFQIMHDLPSTEKPAGDLVKCSVCGRSGGTLTGDGKGGINIPDAECPYKLEPSNTTLKDYENVTGEYHKGEPCPYSDIDLCQEGYCQRCWIYESRIIS